MDILDWEDTEWSMDQDYTEWLSDDIVDWLGLLHSDLEQYGGRILLMGLDGEQFERLKDPKFVRNDLNVRITSHVNAIVRAVTQRMMEYDILSRKKHDSDDDDDDGDENELFNFMPAMKPIQKSPRPTKPNAKHHVNSNRDQALKMNMNFAQISPAHTPKSTDATAPALAVNDNDCYTTDVALEGFESPNYQATGGHGKRMPLIGDVDILPPAPAFGFSGFTVCLSLSYMLFVCLYFSVFLFFYYVNFV